MSHLEMDSTSTVRQQPERLGPVSKNSAVPRLDSDSFHDKLQALYAPILGPLADVERRLQHELQSPYESLMPVLRHGTQLGGKRLRPAMLLLSAAAVDRVNDDHVTLGTVIEMVHTATLVHDDVLDEAETRRHVATMNARWGDHASILLGDYLFAQSFRLAATLPSTEACRWIGEAARLVCEGELRQVLQRDVIDLDQDTYIEMIRGKTAELCQVACQLGARFANGDQAVVESLGAYGSAIGIAFQIADDYLDLWGETETTGKTLGTDINQGKMTLPLIRLLETATADDRAAIIDVLEGPPNQRLARIRPYLCRSDAKQYTRRIAEQYCDQAIEAIGSLRESSAKTSLILIAKFSVNRRF